MFEKPNLPGLFLPRKPYYKGMEYVMEKKASITEKWEDEKEGAGGEMQIKQIFVNGKGIHFLLSACCVPGTELEVS